EFRRVLFRSEAKLFARQQPLAGNLAPATYNPREVAGQAGDAFDVEPGIYILRLRSGTELLKMGVVVVVRQITGAVVEFGCERGSSQRIGPQSAVAGFELQHVCVGAGHGCAAKLKIVVAPLEIEAEGKLVPVLLDGRQRHGVAQAALLASAALVEIRGH